MTSKKLDWIEAYRGGAAAAVVLYHTARHFDRNYGIPVLERTFQFGHAGVDLFFVISGFIILFVHSDDVGRPGRLGPYLLRRLTRLLPGYWVAVVLTVAMAQLGGHPTRTSDIVRAILPVPLATVPVLDVAWTLQYELTFYAAFAVLILNRAAGLALMAIWMLAVAFTAACGWHPELPSPYWGTFNIEFFAGMAAACWLRRHSLPHHGMVLLVGILLFIAAALAEDLGWMDGYASSARLAYGVPSVMLLLGGVEASRLGTLQAPRCLQALGAASYALYLFHFALMGLLWKVWLTAGLGTAVPPVIGFAVFTAMEIAGGIILSQWIETPLMRLMRDSLGRCFGTRKSPRPASAHDPSGQTLKVF